jgi:TPP-dependent pyruvate/acetoin dehydrogenase alpha subunit
LKVLNGELENVEKEAAANIAKIQKENGSLAKENSLVKEIVDMKKLLASYKTLSDKDVNKVEMKCNKLVKEAIDKHEKAIKDSTEKALNQIRIELKGHAGGRCEC